MNRSERTNENERSVSRWDPNRDFFPYGRDPFDRLFRLAGFMDEGGTRNAAAVAPCIDIDEDEDSYEVTAELPGMKPEDVHVELNQNILTITGEKRIGFGDEERQQKKRSRWSERSYGRFTRSFTLPRDADADRLEARFSHGVLTITIPKSEESKPRTIDVKTSN
jgi:HSP20 family protein